MLTPAVAAILFVLVRLKPSFTKMRAVASSSASTVKRDRFWEAVFLGLDCGFRAIAYAPGRRVFNASDRSYSTRAERYRTSWRNQMPLQDVTPINDQLADTIVRAKEPWIETHPGMAWVKLLWIGPETGRWVALFRWNKGYVAAPHKHLSDAHAYVVKGKLQVRDVILE